MRGREEGTTVTAGLRALSPTTRLQNADSAAPHRGSRAARET